jgi:predicted acetyltransferase
MAGLGIGKGIGKAVLKKLLKKHKGKHVYIPITQKEGVIGFGEKAIKEAKAFAKKKQKATASFNKQFGLDKDK